jgi:hypothetical protein
MAQALRTALTRMGLSATAAQYATDTMGLDSLDAWRDLHMDDDLDQLAKNLRSPGGTIQQDGATIRHPGFPVSVKAISNIKVMRLALKHHQLTSRTVTAPEINEAWIATWDFLVDYHKETSKKKYDDEDLPKIVMNDWAKTKEKIVTHFEEVYGKEGTPLAYLLREDDAVAAEADDPHANYGTDHIKELIARAPHTGSTFNADNRTLCRYLKKICVDTAAYDYISKYTANGRQAWKDLLKVYLGPQHTQNQAAIYEAKLQNTHYDGESNRFTYDKNVSIHKEGHTRLEGLVPLGYKGIDEGTKIRYFLLSLRDPRLKTVVELVRGNPSYDTFDKVARRIKDTIVTLKPTKTPSRNVSSVTVINKNGEEVFPGIDPDMTVDDKFYSKPEWLKLSKAQRKGVLYKRQQRGGGTSGKKQQPTKGKGKRSINKLNKKISKLERTIAAFNIDDDNDAAPSESESDDDAPPKKKSKKTTNRTHPALNRRRQT